MVNPRFKIFFVHLLIFSLINVCLYIFIQQFHSVVPFHTYNYQYKAYHYLKDPRSEKGGFDFLRSLGQFDAQWYLKIANEGYPPLSQKNDGVLVNMSYAFFPLYPLALHIVNAVFHNIELTAFLLANLFLLLNFLSLLYTIGKVYTTTIAIKTAYLVFLFPFSIFFRSYYTEGISLFFLIWFCYFLMTRRFVIAAFFLSFLNVAKGNGFLLDIVLFVYAWKGIRGNVRIRKLLLILLIMIAPLFCWILFNFVKTGNPLYFFSARSLWGQSPFLLFNPFVILAKTVLFPLLPFHSFHYSQIDTVVLVATLFFLIKSKKHLRSELWWVSFVLWITPVFIFTLAFTRSQTISFPLFLYLASTLKGKAYFLTVALFGIGLFITSLFFVNWYWIG